MKKLLGLFALLFLIGGCCLNPMGPASNREEGQQVMAVLTNAQNTYYVKANSIPEEVKTDLYQCEQDAQVYSMNTPAVMRMPSGAGIPARQLSYYSRRTECMEAKGYTPKW